MANSDNKQPTYHRQRFLLSFIKQLNDGVSSTDLQKLIFIYIMENKLSYYDFVPYKFGPYSFQLNEDVALLEKNGFIHIVNNNNRRYYTVANQNEENNISYAIAFERGDALIRRAYREYPFYAMNSEIIGRLFHGTELNKFKNEKQKYSQATQVLFTIGYEGKSIESFTNTLLLNDIRLLCDVRKHPYSRKFGFSKEKLKHICETVGIKYVNISNLGIESDKRLELDTESDYEQLFSEYEKELPQKRTELNYLYKLFESNNRIALMCFEKDPQMCHRHIIRDYMVEKYNMASEDI